MADVFNTAVQLRRAIEKQDAAALRRITDAYRAIYSRLAPEIELLADALEAGTLTEGQLFRLDRYKRLIEATEREMERYADYLEIELSSSAKTALALGEQHARELIRASGLVRTQFNTLNAAAIEQLIGFLQPESELYKRLHTIGAYTRDNVKDAIIQFVGLGKSPIALARELRRVYGYSLTSALTTARTVQLYAYREANRASYLANGDVVGGWFWMSALAPTSCMACVSKHGSWHPNSETLNDHHRGYCTMLPAVGNAKEFVFSGDAWKASQGKRHAAGWGNTTVSGTYTNGEDWFKRLPEFHQRRMMGDTRFNAWKQGAFQFSDLWTEHSDDVYGKMIGVRSIKELIPVKELV